MYNLQDSLQDNLYSSVLNKGYFDVPICDIYSNISYNDSIPKTKQFNTFNEEIGKRINAGKDFYYVDSYPNIPSPSLYKESDKDASPYYEKKKDFLELFSVQQGVAEGTITVCFTIIFCLLFVLIYYFMKDYF